MRVGTCSLCGGAVVVEATARHRCTSCNAVPSWSASAPQSRLSSTRAIPLRIVTAVDGTVVLVPDHEARHG